MPVGKLAEGLTRVKEALASPAPDYPRADLSRECIVLSLRAVAAKHREGGCLEVRSPALLSTPGHVRLH